MCGRYKLDLDWSEIVRLYVLDDDDPLDFVPRYNVAPTQRMPVILDDGDHRVARWMHWGLLPPWAAWKDAARAINARAETVASLRTFAGPFRKRRALIPATGFYEWQRLGTTKAPFLFRPTEGVMAFAGLWQPWQDPADGHWVDTFTVITCPANGVVAPVHDRMPVVLPRAAWDRWLAPETSPEVLQGLLVPLADAALEGVPVSPAVGNVKNDSPETLA